MVAKKDPVKRSASTRKYKLHPRLRRCYGTWSRVDFSENHSRAVDMLERLHKIIGIEGTREECVSAFGRLCLESINSPSNDRLIDCESDTLLSIFRICSEISRQLLEIKFHDQPLYGNPDLVCWVQSAIGNDPRESFLVIYTDIRGLLLDAWLISGNYDSAPVDVPKIVMHGYEIGAKGLVLAHNHPMGDPSPSRPDILITQKISSVASAFGMTLMEHFIVTRSGSVSVLT